MGSQTTQVSDLEEPPVSDAVPRSSFKRVLTGSMAGAVLE